MNALIVAECQQMPVARHNEIRLRGHRRRYNMIIVRIGEDYPLDLPRRHQCGGIKIRDQSLRGGKTYQGEAFRGHWPGEYLAQFG
jgi:hypothetical protein